MPVTPTYPGVYVEEIPSGVRTITGVSTSVTAFVGGARRGSIDKAVRVLNYSEFEKNFGELSADLEMGYSVRQFFLNGGSEAWVIRIAKNAIAAKQEMKNTHGDLVLKLISNNEGSVGNDITVEVDYETDNPGSTFNLTLILNSKNGSGRPVIETFRNLSMNSKDARFVKNALADGGSKLVTAELITLTGASAATFSAKKGQSISCDLSRADFSKIIDDSHNSFHLKIDGKEPVEVTLDAAAIADIGKLKDAVAAKLPAGVSASVIDNKYLQLESSVAGETSSVRVLPGETKDVASRLMLGPLFGGTEIDAAAYIRPKVMPDCATIISGAIDPAALVKVPSVKNSLKIILDGYIADVSLDGPDLTGSLKAMLGDLATRLQAKIRESKPSNPAFKNFTAESDGTSKLVLKSGSRGDGATIVVKATKNDPLADDLKLTIPGGADVTKASSTNVTLEGGSEQDYSEADAYNLFIADRSKRKGIYALEAVDLFNLLVLPGVTDTGILMDASSYCQERRAFLIVDAPQADDTPDAMASTAMSAALPKTDYAAAYYPWIKIADPLANGRLRTVAPSGTIAGLFSRVDSTRGVWKAPAGTEASLVGVQAVEYTLTDGENGVLNPLGVNCLRILPAYGAVAWGARTLRGADQMADEYKYVPVRRLALFIEESLYRGTQWVVFEPNDEPLWAQIRLNVGAFMHNLFRQGAFQGKTPKEAYFVKCDGETTTQNDVSLGIVNILVGFAPLKPAEFVIIKLQQMAGQIQT